MSTQVKFLESIRPPVKPIRIFSANNEYNKLEVHFQVKNSPITRSHPPFKDHFLQKHMDILSEAFRQTASADNRDKRS